MIMIHQFRKMYILYIKKLIFKNIFMIYLFFILFIIIEQLYDK
jgi:hypothetical protein